MDFILWFITTSDAISILDDTGDINQKTLPLHPSNFPGCPLKERQKLVGSPASPLLSWERDVDANFSWEVSVVKKTKRRLVWL